MRAYLRLAAWCIRHRFVTALLAIAFFVGSLMLVPLLPTGFIPPDDLAKTQAAIELAPGSTFAQTRASAERARALVSKIADVRRVYVAIGGGSTGADPFAVGGAPEARKATLLVNLSPRGERSRSKQAIESATSAMTVAVTARAFGSPRSDSAARVRNWCLRSPATTARYC